jgi:adhesin transport system membrane fusion protein
MSERQDIEALDAELPVEPARAAELMLYAISALCLIAFLWSATARLDRVTRGDGRVVPSSHLQEVQYLEGGIIKEILVKAGDRVSKGEVMVRLDPTQMNAQFSGGREGYHLLAARIARLEAETNNAALAFDADLAKQAPAIVAQERALYEQRRKEFDSALSIEIGKRDDATAAFDAASSTAALANQELAIVGPLAAKGIEPKIELLRARQRAAAADSEKSRAEIAVKNAQSEVDRLMQAFRATAGDELAKARSEMAAISGNLPALRDKVARTEVRAPIEGVVNRVLVATIGGVVQPGQTIVEVVPAGDTPLIEAKIKQSDIGFLHIGQEARVNISAYDSSVYGSLTGEIEQISADAIVDEKTGDRHFLIKVRTKDGALKTKKGSLPILPGMAAEVNVLNGKRTVLAYMLKPIAEVSNKALKEN